MALLFTPPGITFIGRKKAVDLKMHFRIFALKKVGGFTFIYSRLDVKSAKQHQLKYMGTISFSSRAALTESRDEIMVSKA